jgi:hypothetical protein
MQISVHCYKINTDRNGSVLLRSRITCEYGAKGKVTHEFTHNYCYLQLSVSADILKARIYTK